MPAVRTSKLGEPSTSHSHPHGSSSTPKHKKPAYKHHKPPQEDAAPLAVPGVQKIKAALRQTRRLLAKDTLAADVRRATERRERALVADLVQAEQARTERAMATRYHMVKFFERQKVVRRIQQTQRQLAQAGTDKKALRGLEARLAALRVDLNYILHYPRTKKYISLFPPEVRRGDASSRERLDADTDAGSAAEREALRTQIRERMARGELSTEPELDGSRAKGPGMGAHLAGGKSTDNIKAGSKRGEKGRVESAKKGLGDDAFFGDDKDDEDDEESADDNGTDEGSEASDENNDDNSMGTD